MSLLLREAEIRSAEAEEPVQTVYIGGGTPSLIPPSLLYKLVKGLQQILPLEDVIEFTTEANPGTLTDRWLETALESGINRISFGMQSSCDQILSLLGRIHRCSDVWKSMYMARNAGFNNINLDLMFGIPSQTSENWTDTLNTAIQMNPEHISSYGLIPEEGTPLFEALQNKKYTLPEPDDEREMYETCKKKLTENGFLQYEISNFAKKGYECKHNIGYWRQIPYIGLGVSAASMIRLHINDKGMQYTRKKNPDSFEDYEYAIDHLELNRNEEMITNRESRFETMMLGLRMIDGVSKTEFLKKHGLTIEHCYGKKLTELRSNGLIIEQEGCWKLTSRGFDVQNSVLVELMDE